MEKKLTQNEKELLDLLRSGDDDFTQNMFIMLGFTLAFGNEFLTEMNDYLDKQDLVGMKNALEGYKNRFETLNNNNT